MEMDDLPEGKRRQRVENEPGDQYSVDVGGYTGHMVGHSGHVGNVVGQSLSHSHSGHSLSHGIRGGVAPQVMQIGDYYEWACAKWMDVERSPHRVYLGVFLCIVGIIAGGAVFPLMEMYEEPPVLKVGSRNMILAASFGFAWWHTTRDIDVMKQTIQKALSDRSLGAVLVFNGFAHAASSLLAQLALDLTGDEVTAVLTNCSCVFAVLFSYLHDPNSISGVEKKAAFSLGLVILYFLIVMRPSFLGVVACLGVALVNAIYYIGQKRLRITVPFVSLMAIIYVESATFIFLSCFYLHPEFGLTTWFYVLLNLRYLVPTIAVSICTAIFQGSLVLALTYCSPIVVTGSLSLEPLTTLAFDWVFGRPTPDLHTLLIFLSLIACTAVISLSGPSSTGQKKPTRSFT